MKLSLDFLSILLISSFLIFSCKSSESNPRPSIVKYQYTFEQSNEGWTAGFADYPEANKEIYELSHIHTSLPNSLNNGAKGLQITGHNRSDDLFMFWKKKVEGLTKNQMYKVKISINIASQYPTTSAEIGGSPGASVYLKAGVVFLEPKAELQSDGYWLMNVDKGQQSTGGATIKVLGDIGIPGEEYVYKLIERTNEEESITLKTDNEEVYG